MKYVKMLISILIVISFVTACKEKIPTPKINNVNELMVKNQ